MRLPLLISMLAMTAPSPALAQIAPSPVTRDQAMIKPPQVSFSTE